MQRRWQVLALVLLSCGAEEPARGGAREQAETTAAETEPTRARPATARPDGLYGATFRPEPASDACPVVNGSLERAYATVGERLESSVHVSSTNDENTEYALVASVAEGECDSVVVVLGGQVRAPSSSLDGSGSCEVTFSLDRAGADRAAALFGVERGDRAELGSQLEGHVSIPMTSFRAGEPVIAQLELFNPESGAPLQVCVISHPSLQWNARFAGTRDGSARVPERSDAVVALSVLGGTAWQTLGAGGHLSQPIWLDRQLDLSTPGRYQIGVTIDVDLAPPQIDPDRADARHRRWTRTYHGSVSFEVR